VDIARVIADGLRSGDLLWSLPLVAALGPDGRRESVRWLERCLHRMVDLAGIRLRSGSIHDRITSAAAAAAVRSVEELSVAIAKAGLRGDPAVDAIGVLYVAYWQAVHRDDNQFAVSQENVFRRIRTFWSDDEWGDIIRLAVEEYQSTLAVAPGAEPGRCRCNGERETRNH
jgi:hypothetical protein